MCLLAPGPPRQSWAAAFHLLRRVIFLPEETRAVFLLCANAMWPFWREEREQGCSGTPWREVLEPPVLCSIAYNASGKRMGGRALQVLATEKQHPYTPPNIKEDSQVSFTSREQRSAPERGRSLSKMGFRTKLCPSWHWFVVQNQFENVVWSAVSPQERPGPVERGVINQGSVALSGSPGWTRAAVRQDWDALAELWRWPPDWNNWGWGRCTTGQTKGL